MCVESPSGWLLSLELAPKPVTPHPLKNVNDTKMLHKVPLLDNILLLESHASLFESISGIIHRRSTHKRLRMLSGRTEM